LNFSVFVLLLLISPLIFFPCPPGRYVTSYSRLGLVWAHVLQCKTTKDAAVVVAAIVERKKQAVHAKSLLPRTDIDAYADPVGGEDDTESEAPPEVFHVT
jgi:hypothetical protein